MKQAYRKVMILAVLALMLIPIAAAGQSLQGSNSTGESMTLWQARRIVAAGNSAWTSFADNIDRSSFRFTLDNFEFDAFGAKDKKVHFRVDLRQLEAVSAKCHAPWVNNNNWCTLVNAEGKTLKRNGTGVDLAFFNNLWTEKDVNNHCSASCVAAAKLFATAVNRLHAAAADAGYPLRTFPQQAAIWRAMANKPPLAEGARIRRLAAEDAIKRQKPDEALNYYELGVESDPVWAQGWFNAAVVSGQLGYYADAAEHMQNYLELVPNAPDARSARDQIDLWKYKAGQQPASD